MCVVNLQTTEDLNPKVAADGLSSCRVKYLFWYPLILHVVLRTFLETKTSNKNHTLKNESFYPLRKFQANPPIFTQLRSRSFLFCFFLTSSSFLGRLSPELPLHWKLSGTQRPSDRCGDEQTFLTLPEMEPRFIGHYVCLLFFMFVLCLFSCFVSLFLCALCFCIVLCICLLMYIVVFST